MTARKKKKISRKRFLGYGAAGAVTVGAAAIPLSSEPFYEKKYPVVEENKVELKSNGKTVCILGGGLSGLQAGVELAARGFTVTLLEKTGLPGGKLKTWRDKTFGPKDHPLKKDPNFKGFVREHGVHAIWGFYNNLREFMGRYNWKLQSLPKDFSMYTFIDKKGIHSHIPRTRWPKPYDKIELLLQAGKMDHIENGEGMNALSALLKMMTFDMADKKQREYLDTMTLEEYCKKLGLSDSLIYKVFDSIVEMAYFNNIDKVSAITVPNLFQLAMGSTNDLWIDLYSSPPGETFLEPMVEYIKMKGGSIHYNTEVSKVLIENEHIKSVQTSQIKPGVRRCQVCGGLIYGNKHFEHCPFCGAEAEKLKVLVAEERSLRTFTADYFISAMDIPASQKFIGRNIKEFQEKEYFKNILKLHATEVFVVNLWYEGRKLWEQDLYTQQKLNKNDFVLDFFATGFDYLGITLNWASEGELEDGQKRKAIMKEYQDQDVTIIETQIAKTHNVKGLTNKQIAYKCHNELKGVIKTIPDFKSFYVNKWRHYTTYIPGDEKRRPSIQSPLENLLFIGDMPSIDHPAVFMEKTNVTAKMAVNILLDKIKQKEGRIKILQSGTPSGMVSTLQTLSSVKV